jgi:hypothetical protein
MPEQQQLSWRQMIAGFFAMMACFGAWYKMSGTAVPGSYTWLFDTSLLVVGTVGLIVTLLWPRKDDPSDKQRGGPH